MRDVSREALPANNQLQRARRTANIYPAGHHAKILQARMTLAPADVAAGLRVAEGAEVIERQRLTCGPDDEPLLVSVSYFPATLADPCPNLLKRTRIKQGTTLYIEKRTGRAARSVASSIWT